MLYITQETLNHISHPQHNTGNSKIRTGNSRTTPHRKHMHHITQEIHALHHTENTHKKYTHYITQ